MKKNFPIFISSIVLIIIALISPNTSHAALVPTTQIQGSFVPHATGHVTTTSGGYIDTVQQGTGYLSFAYNLDAQLTGVIQTDQAGKQTFYAEDTPTSNTSQINSDVNSTFGSGTSDLYNQSVHQGAIDATNQLGSQEAKGITGPVGTYTTLAPIGTFINTTVPITNLNTYLNGMFKLGVALAGALAVIMIIIGGIQYMSTDAIGKKEEGKKRITAAITGLIVALGSYMLLNTISPSLLSTKLTLNDIGVAPLRLAPGQPGYPYQPGDPNYGTVLGPNGQPIPGTPGQYSSNSGPITSLTQAGTTFPDQTWNDYALQQINASGLSNLSPSDISNYCPGGASDQCYLSILASIAQKESDFNPKDSMLDVNNTNSVGLLSLSYTDLGGKYSEDQLKDPYTNINAGIQILQNQIQSGGCISCQNSSGKWIGGSAYWSTLRPPGGG